MYRGVDWANSLPPPIPPPTSTLEPSPDVVTRTAMEKRLDARPRVWQVSLRACYLTSVPCRASGVCIHFQSELDLASYTDLLSDTKHLCLLGRLS